MPRRRKWCAILVVAFMGTALIWVLTGPWGSVLAQDKRTVRWIDGAASDYPQEHISSNLLVPQLAQAGLTACLAAPNVCDQGFLLRLFTMWIETNESGFLQRQNFELADEQPLRVLASGKSAVPIIIVPSLKTTIQFIDEFLNTPCLTVPFKNLSRNGSVARLALVSTRPWSAKPRFIREISSAFGREGAHWATFPSDGETFIVDTSTNGHFVRQLERTLSTHLPWGGRVEVVASVRLVDGQIVLLDTPHSNGIHREIVVAFADAFPLLGSMSNPSARIEVDDRVSRVANRDTMVIPWPFDRAGPPGMVLDPGQPNSTLPTGMYLFPEQARLALPIRLLEDNDGVLIAQASEQWEPFNEHYVIRRIDDPDLKGDQIRAVFISTSTSDDHLRSTLHRLVELRNKSSE